MKKTPFKRVIALMVSGVLLVSLAGFSYEAAHKPLPSVLVQPSALQAVPSENVIIAWPPGLQSALGSLEEGVLASSSGQESVQPTASIAKIITALSVLKQKPFDLSSSGATITLDATDVGYYDYYLARGGSVVPVQAGEQLTELQALQALLLPSANNIADSLARWAFGSVEGYVMYTNTMVKDIGLTRTHITDASGFSPDTVSTASELVMLGRQALLQPVIASIVSQKEASLPVIGAINNTNVLLGSEGTVGIKTGHTYEAGYCLLFASTYIINPGHSATIIGAILGGKDMPGVFQSARDITQAARVNFVARQVIKKGAKVGSFTSAWGKQTDILAADTLTYYGWRGLALRPEVTLASHQVPVHSSTVVGIIDLNINGQPSSVSAVTDRELPVAGIAWRLAHYF